MSFAVDGFSIEFSERGLSVMPPTESKVEPGELRAWLKLSISPLLRTTALEGAMRQYLALFSFRLS